MDNLYLKPKQFVLYYKYRKELLFILEQYVLYNESHTILIKRNGMLYDINTAIDWYQNEIFNLFLV